MFVVTVCTLAVTSLHETEEVNNQLKLPKNKFNSNNIYIYE